MRPAAVRFIVLSVFLVTIALLNPARLPGQDGKKDAKIVEAQKKSAEEYWKQVFEDVKLPLVETAHFLIVGGKSAKDKEPAKELALVGEILEQEYAKACSVLEQKEPPPWQGKLTVFILPEARKYAHMIRLLERRKAEEGEIGTFESQGDFPYVVACESEIPGDLGAAGNAGAQVAALLLTMRLKTPLPPWLGEGFGRATVLHAGPAAALTADRRKAAAIMKKNNRNLDDIFNSSLPAAEQSYLRGSFMEYLAYSGQTSKFLPFVDALRADKDGNPGSIDAALKNAGTTKEQLQTNWQKYVKNVK